MVVLLLNFCHLAKAETIQFLCIADGMAGKHLSINTDSMTLSEEFPGFDGNITYETISEQSWIKKPDEYLTATDVSNRSFVSINRSTGDFHLAELSYTHLSGERRAIAYNGKCTRKLF